MIDLIRRREMREDGRKMMEVYEVDLKSVERLRGEGKCRVNFQLN